MNTDTIAGVVILVTGLVFASSVYVWYRYRKGNRAVAIQTAGMAAAILLTTGALLPQAIRNSTDPAALEVAFSPFLLALFPIAVILKLPGEFRILHNANQDEKTMILLQLLGLLMILVMYDVFMVQYAAATSSTELQAGFIFLTCVYIILTLISFIIAFDQKWRNHLFEYTGLSLTVIDNLENE